MWRLAWRNLLRNRTRTFITVTAIALSYGLFLVSAGINAGMYAKMLRSAARTAGGDVLVHGKGYWETRASDVVLTDPASAVAALEQVEGVTAVIPRVVASGLLSSPRGNAGVQLSGIDVEREAALRDMRRHATRGVFFGVEHDDPIVLGTRLASDLGVDVGDRVVLTGTDPAGEMARQLFYVTDLVETGSAMADGALAYTTLEAAQRALGLGTAVTQIGILTGDGLALEAVRDRAARALGARAEALEIMTWKEAMPEMVGFIEMDKSMNVVFSLVIFLIVAFGIANTFMMAVMERVRELGLLSAIGVGPWRIGGLVLRETVLMCLVALAAGLGVGLAGHGYLATEGLDLAALMGGSELQVSGVVLDDMMIFSQLDPVGWATAGAVVLGLVLLSALYPAVRATRLEPAAAMRTYE